MSSRSPTDPGGCLIQLSRPPHTFKLQFLLTSSVDGSIKQVNGEFEEVLKPLKIVQKGDTDIDLPVVKRVATNKD